MGYHLVWDDDEMGRVQANEERIDESMTLRSNGRSNVIKRYHCEGVEDGRRGDAKIELTLTIFFSLGGSVHLTTEIKTPLQMDNHREAAQRRVARHRFLCQLG